MAEDAYRTKLALADKNGDLYLSTDEAIQAFPLEIDLGIALNRLDRIANPDIDDTLRVFGVRPDEEDDRAIMSPPTFTETKRLKSFRRQEMEPHPRHPRNPMAFVAPNEIMFDENIITLPRNIPENLTPERARAIFNEVLPLSVATITTLDLIRIDKEFDARPLPQDRLLVFRRSTGQEL